MQNKKLVLFSLVNALLLTACNNDAPTAKSTTQPVTQYTAASVLLSGKVENKTCHVEAQNEGEAIVSTNSENGRYQLDIPAQTKLPIVLQCGEHIAVVVDTDVTRYDINALTTAIATRAKALGGYTRKNMILAASDSVHTPDANKTSTGFRGDPTTQYGGWH